MKNTQTTYTNGIPTYPGYYEARHAGFANSTVFKIRLVREGGELLLAETYLRDRTIPAGYTWRGPLPVEGSWIAAPFAIQLPPNTTLVLVSQGSDGSRVYEYYGIRDLCISKSLSNGGELNAWLNKMIAADDAVRPKEIAQPSGELFTSNPADLDLEMVPAGCPYPLFPVDARSLHTFLQIGKDFSTWMKDRIKGFKLVDYVDYMICSPNVGSKECGGKSNGRGDHNAVKYWLTLHAAQWLAAHGKSERGARVVKYLYERLEAVPQVVSHLGSLLPPSSEAVVDADTGELIPVDLKDLAGFCVSGRKLHRALEVGRHFAAWIVDRLASTRLVENQDYIVCYPDSGSKECVAESKGRGGHNAKEYWFTMDAAKALSLLQNNAKGDEVRAYFIAAEKRNKPAAHAFQIPTTLAGALRLAADTSEANEQLKLANAQLVTDLDVKEVQLGNAVIEKDEQVRKSDAIGRAVALEKESKILSGWLKEVSRITGVGPNRGLKILQAHGILCRKKVEGCSNTDEPGITTPYLDKEWLCYKLQPAVGKTITEDKIGDDGEVVIGADGKPAKVVVEVLDAAGDQVRVNSRTVKVTPKGCEHILKLLSTCDETLLWRLIDLVKVPELRVLRGRYTFSEHHNFAHKMFPKSSDTVRRMIRFVKPTHPFEIWVAWIYAESVGPEKLVGRGNTLEQAYRELAKVVSAY